MAAPEGKPCGIIFHRIPPLPEPHPHQGPLLNLQIFSTPDLVTLLTEASLFNVCLI